MSTSGILAPLDVTCRTGSLGSSLPRWSAFRLVLKEEEFVQFRDDIMQPYLPAALSHPWTSIASHADPPWVTARGWGHPRTVGTYGRLFGTYVRDERLLTLMEAVRKSSLMPAERLRERVPAMARKGRLQEGADADIVVFDPERFAERATFDSSTPSKGMRFVVVAGQVVVADGELLPVAAGLPVRAPFEP